MVLFGLQLQDLVGTELKNFVLTQTGSAEQNGSDAADGFRPGSVLHQQTISKTLSRASAGPAVRPGLIPGPAVGPAQSELGAPPALPLPPPPPLPPQTR